ncbi:small GTP-binding protein, putative [Trichomonas vaginalis G3]|uniref:Small GTP-binding protein, putative n=1 Tax=Trichomonas vaginalis (strain ATCC PRA-98 / G3) TaxID=412133 RepID=A2FKH1_TRIV3|nr:GTPase protein [Trichomonas vaginalis G3]EAX94583.1 small GTP-binding protein, putative [Trichomonas vaginalis G3]KAI5542783.1 GTPase protein [Trichomonas vaginalis G3]|eukprot:XP_001307513.1 small GTP-binding protein [Trichomonas vaginalis G3]
MIMNQQSSSITLKVILAGPHNSGKTMFLWRWSSKNGEFTEGPTIGADFVCREVTRGDKKFKIHLWDTAGQEAYHSITAPYFRSCSAILLMFDLTDRTSFENLDYWLNMIKENTNSSPIIYLIGNKSDVPSSAVSDSELEEYAHVNNLKLFKASAKENINIERINEDLINSIISANYVNMPEIETIPLPKKAQKNGDCC